jgi:putative drug exporter of the RND superfamily
VELDTRRPLTGRLPRPEKELAMTLVTAPKDTDDRSPQPPANARRPGAAERLARWSTRHRWKALASWVLLVAAAIVGGGAAGTRVLSDADSGAGQSGRADRVVEQAGYPANLTERVLIQAPRGDQLSAAQATSVAGELRTRLTGLPEVSSVGSLVRAKDGRSAMVAMVLDVDGATGTAADDIADKRIQAVLDATAAVAKANPQLSIAQMGDASLNHAINDTVGKDFKRAETLSLPISLGILLLTFGALFAAGVPVLLALSAVGTAIGLAGLVSHVLPVSDSLNSVILLIGMAVGVDYSLFYVRRTREERARGASRREAIDIAAATSGRAVVVSGIAVIVAMAGLLLSGNVVFSSMAVGTMLVVAVAMLGSLTVLPAVLSLLGDKVDRPRIPLVHRLRRHGSARFWPAVMRVVLAKPLVSLLLAGTALATLALPALGMQLGEAGADSLPRSIPIMRTYDAMTAAFPQTGFAHTVVIWSDSAQPLDKTAVRDGVATMVTAAERTHRFADLSDANVDFAPNGRTATVDLAMTGDFNTDRSKQSLAQLRDDLAPALQQRLPGAEVAVTGDTAGSVDFTSTLRAHLPLVFGFVLAVTFVVLVLAFRSVVVAATAVVLNLLSVGAAYGLLVLIFQHGFAVGLLGAQQTGYIVDWLPLFLFVILFGLSMDYHVFVVSRIREAHKVGEPTRAAVARGVIASAGVVTSAAAVMIGVFGIFGTLSLVEFKQLGVGLAAAVLLDATIVRAVMLPAAMALLGHRNWWLPAWLDRRLPAAH